MWNIIIWIGLSVLSYFLFRPQQQQQDNPTPGEVSGTTVDSSSPVPVLFGTRLIKTPNCVWYGDVGTTPIIKCGEGKK